MYKQVFNKKNVKYWRKHQFKALKSYCGYNVDEKAPGWASVMYMIEFAIWFAVIPCSFILIGDLFLHSFDADTLFGCLGFVALAPMISFFGMAGVLSFMIIFKRLIDIVKMIFKK